MALGYQEWLKAKGIKKASPRTRKAYDRSGHAGQAPRAPTPRPGGGGAADPNRPIFSYASQIAQDPLSIPFDSELLWQGKGRPNLTTIAGQRGGFENLTPVQRPGGGWGVFGQETDLMPDWARQQGKDITRRGQQVQAYGQQQVAPWLANQLGALGNVQGQAQTNFANLIGQTGAQLANAAGQVGPGAGQGQIMAPFASRMNLGAELSAGQAASQSGSAAYQASVDQLQGSNLAQGLSASLAQEVMRIPDKYEQQRLEFERSLSPVLMQLEGQRDQSEQQRRMALAERGQWRQEFAEGKRQFNENLRTEREVAGSNLAFNYDQLDAETAAAGAEAQADAVGAQFRDLAKIRGGLDQGQRLLDNAGRGFAAKGPARFHGRQVQWEQASDGMWYGTVGKGGGGRGGSGPKTIYTDSTVAERLQRGLLAGWEGVPGEAGDPLTGAGRTAGREGWRGMGRDDIADIEARLGGNIDARSGGVQAFKVAQWVLGNRQFLMRNGKLTTPQLRAFIDNALPDVNSGLVMRYITMLAGQ